MSDADSSAWKTAQDQWMLITGIILLVLAALILAISLFLPETQAVLSNGILMGAVFSILHAVVMMLSADTAWLRLAAVTAALAITIAVGYLKFARGDRKDSLPVPTPNNAAFSAGTVQAHSPDVRLTAVDAWLNPRS